MRDVSKYLTGVFLYIVIASTSAFISSQSLSRVSFINSRNNVNPNLLVQTRKFSSFNRGGPEDSYNSFRRDDEFDDDELRQRLTEQEVYHSGNNMFDVDTKPEDVHIILFFPDSEKEGMHSIEYPKGSGNNVILAFEGVEECNQFCSMLKQQQFFEPTPQMIKLRFLESYCDSLGVSIQTIPKGMNIKPPTEAVTDLTMNPNIVEEVMLLDYLFDISAPQTEEDTFETALGGGAWE